MLLSKKWLSKINENFSTINNQDLASAFNAIGVEVEQIIRYEVPDQLKLGRLISFTKHPNSDHLNVCNVAVDNKKYQIVCGAKKLKEEQYVVVALEGCKLPNGLVICNREICGIESQGMLCSLGEIMSCNINNISEDDQETIIQIPYDGKIRTESFFDDFGLNDTYFELSIPSNRPELNGIYFLAYELNLQFNFSVFEIPVKNILRLSKEDELLQLDDFEELSSYALLNYHIYKNPKQSLMIKINLLYSDTKTYNNVNDLASFLSKLIAQPLFFINRNLIGSTKLTIKKVDREYTIVDQYGIDRKIPAGTIVNMLGDYVVSVPGQFLNKQYLAEENSPVYIEMASFKFSYFLDHLKPLNFTNQNSYYLKNPAPSILQFVANFIAMNQAWFNLENGSIICAPKVYKANEIKVDFNNLLNFLGINKTRKEVNHLLNKIGIHYSFNKVVTPIYRNDLKTMGDIAEEVLKAIDINDLQPVPIQQEIISTQPKNDFKKYLPIINYLVNQNFYELKTYNLTNEKDLNLFNWLNINSNLSIFNFNSLERRYLRKNIFVQMLNVLKANLQHKENALNLFEIQKIQINEHDANDVLCCLISTANFVNKLDESKIHNSIYMAKAIADQIVVNFNIHLSVRINQKHFDEIYDNQNVYYYHNDEIVGVVGKIKKALLEEHFKLKDDIYCIWFNLSKSSTITKQEFKFKFYSELNPIYKTITFSNPKNVSTISIFSELLKIEYIEDVSLVDVFDNENDKTYTISLRIQPMDKNFTNDEINGIFWNAINKLSSLELFIKQ